MKNLPCSLRLFALAAALALNLITGVQAQTSAVSFSAPTYSVTGSNFAPTSAIITVNRAAGAVGAASVKYVAYWSYDDSVSVYNTNINPGGVADLQQISNRSVLNASASGVLSWADGDFASKTFTVPVRKFTSGVKLGRGVLTLALVTPMGAATLGAQNTAKLTIEDPNAASGGGVIQFSKPQFFAKKDAGTMTVTLNRSGDATGAASVTLNTSSTLPTTPQELSVMNLGSADATLNAELPPTATAGTDYTAQTNLVVSWASGESGSKTVSIPVVNNANPSGTRGNQRFGLTLSSPTGASLGYMSNAHGVLISPSRQVFSAINYASNHALRIWVPPAGTPINGVLFWLPGSGASSVGVADDPQWQSFARSLGFALVGAADSNFYMNTSDTLPMVHGAGKLLTNLKLLADATGRPEIANAPVIFSGFSMGGFNSIGSVECMPERFVCFIGHKSSDWTEITDADVTATPGLLNVPGLLIAGGNGDGNVEPGWIEQSAFLPWRSRGAQIAAVPDWGTGHNHEGSLGFNLAFSFIGEVVKLRYPVGADPVSGPVSLNPIPTANGWLGDTYYAPAVIDTTITGIRRQSGQVAAGWDAFPTVAPATGSGAYTPTGGQTATQFSWLPSETFARAYRTAVQRAEPTYRYAANPDNSGQIEGNSTGAPVPANSSYRLLRRENAPLYAPVQFTAPSILNSAVVGQTYPVEVDVRTLTNVTSVQFFDGTTPLGTDTTAPYTATWTPSTTGISTLNAIVTLSSGTVTQYSAFQPVAVNTGTAAGMLSFAHTAYDAFRSNGNATVTVLRQGGKAGAVSALVSVGAFGTAVSGTDYTFTSAAVNWADGDAAPKTVTIPLTTSQKRLNRTLHLTISTPTGGATLFTAPGQNSHAPYCPDRLKTFVTIFDDTATNLGLWSNTLLPGTYSPHRAYFAENGFFLQTQGGSMGNSDSGQMVTRTLSGDGTVTARIQALSRSGFGSGTEGRFAIVLRNGSAANAQFVGASAMVPFATTNLKLEAVRRLTAGAGLTVSASPVTLTAPTAATWLRITRASDTFIAQYSTDGTAWTTIEAVTLAGLPANLTAGLVFTGGHRSYAGWCVADSLTLTGPNAPAAPTSLSATPTATQINLSWTDASASETGFIIERSTEGTSFHYLTTAAANATSYTDSAVSIGTTYTYRLRSTSSSGDSVASSSTSAALPSPPVITANQSTASIINAAFSYGIVASQSPTSYALVSGSLPAGLTLNTTTGVISGTPTALGTYTPAFTATNLVGTSAAVAVTITISNTPILLTGSVIGTAGSYNNGTATVDKAFDGNLTTFFDAPTANGNWAGLDFGAGNEKVIHEVRYAPRSGSPFTDRMIGAIIQGSSSADFTNGVVNLYTIPSAPTAGVLTTQAISNSTPIRYVRILMPNGSYGNVAELQFYGLPPLPAAPSNLAATASSSTQINLTWTDNSTNETGFKLERSPNGSTGWTQIAAPAANATAESDSGLSVGTIYYYRLGAANAAGESSYTAIASATTFTGVQSFRSIYGLASNGTQDLLTPAGDGVPNILKYAFNMIGVGAGQGSTLATPNAAILSAAGNAGLPRQGVDGAGKLQITYVRRKAALNPGVTYAVEFSDAFANWATNPSANEVVTSLDPTFERVTLTDSLAAPAKRFARVKVTTP